MTFLTADFEAGSDGSNITTSDPGSANAWDVVTTFGSLLTYSSDVAVLGSLCMKADNTSNAAAKRTQWTSTSTGSPTDHYVRFYFRMTALPGADSYIFASTGCWLRVLTTGEVDLYRGGPTFVGHVSGGSIVSPDTWYRAELHIINSATVGQLEVKIFEGNSTSSVGTFTSAANLDTGAATDDIYFGSVLATGGSWILYEDEIVAGAASYPGPVAGEGQILLVSADSVDGAWTDQANGTSLAAAIDESTASDTDFIRSEQHPSSSGCRVKLASGTDPASSTGHVIHWRVRKETATGETINGTVKLYQGGGNSQGAGTLIASFDRNGVDGSGWTTYDETLSSGEADSITDYGDLYLEFHASAA